MYTIDDLRGKYVKVGTPEAEVFLDACEKLGIRWSSGLRANDFIPELESVCFYENEIWQAGCAHWIQNACSKFTPKPQWSIHTNDKPLCELTDEQYGKMRRMHDAGATIQSLNEDGYGFQDCALPTWISNGVYRVKTKSERELFIETAMQLMTSETERTLEQQFGALFDSGKFNLAKDGE